MQGYTSDWNVADHENMKPDTPAAAPVVAGRLASMALPPLHQPPPPPIIPFPPRPPRWPPDTERYGGTGYHANPRPSALQHQRLESAYAGYTWTGTRYIYTS